jgi:hypothetical protein
VSADPETPVAGGHAGGPGEAAAEERPRRQEQLPIALEMEPFQALALVVGEKGQGGLATPGLVERLGAREDDLDVGAVQGAYPSDPFPPAVGPPARCSRRASSRSDSIMIRTSSGKGVRGFQPSTRVALEGSPRR